MTSQIPNHPVTPEAMARLTLDEQLAFEAAAMTVAQDQKPSLEVIVTIVLTVQRLITEPAVRPEARIPGAEVGVSMIRAERARQVAVEGYDEEHDARHRDGELSMASAAYALDSAGCPLAAVDAWPFTSASFKPGPKPLDSLVKAGALCAAEIDRIVAEEVRRG